MRTFASNLSCSAEPAAPASRKSRSRELRIQAYDDIKQVAKEMNKRVGSQRLSELKTEKLPAASEDCELGGVILSGLLVDK
jgi:hypothetical protein